MPVVSFKRVIVLHKEREGLGVLFRNELGLRERKKSRGWWKYVDKI
jgi:hypothetical protein